MVTQSTRSTAGWTEQTLPCQQYQIRHFKSTPIHPTAQANNERMHRTIGGILKTMLHKYGKDFEEALPYAVYCINNGAIDGTSISPYEMLYGRKPAEPNSALAGQGTPSALK